MTFPQLIYWYMVFVNSCCWRDYKAMFEEMRGGVGKNVTNELEGRYCRYFFFSVFFSVSVAIFLAYGFSRCCLLCLTG